jgi:integrase
MFARAVIDKVIGTSPCMGIRLPEIADAEYVLPTADQVRLIADTLPERYRAVAFIAAGCGLRTGEIFGLEWDDIDTERREIRVRRQLKVSSGRGRYFGPTKTRTSVRTVEMPEVVRTALVAHEAAVPRVPIEVNDETDPAKPVRRTANPIFVNEGGQLIRPSWWWHVWSAMIAETGLPDVINLRALRHYFATVLIFGGANVKTVQLAMGHTTPTITLNTYVGYWPDALDRTRSLVDAAFCTQSVPARVA